MIFECFYDWIREMRKTKRDLSYWTEDEENVAEYAWNAGWEESKRFHEAEINALKNRISLLEKEIAFVELRYAKKEEKPIWGNF